MKLHFIHQKKKFNSDCFHMTKNFSWPNIPWQKGWFCVWKKSSDHFILLLVSSSKLFIWAKNANQNQCAEIRNMLNQCEDINANETEYAKSWRHPYSVCCFCSFVVVFFSFLFFFTICPILFLPPNKCLSMLDQKTRFLHAFCCG